MLHLTMWRTLWFSAFIFLDIIKNPQNTSKITIFEYETTYTNWEPVDQSAPNDTFKGPNLFIFTNVPAQTHGTGS